MHVKILGRFSVLSVCKCRAWNFSTNSSIPLRYPSLDMNLKAKQIRGWWNSSFSSISVFASVYLMSTSRHVDSFFLSWKFLFIFKYLLNFVLVSLFFLRSLVAAN